MQVRQTASISTAARLAGALAAGCFTAGVPEVAAAATVVNTFNAWTLYANEDGQKICFLATLPAASEPAGLKREAALLYVSAWPKDGVKAEISIKLGFPGRKGSEPVLSITGAAAATFKLFLKDDRAFVADATAELKLIDAMKKGSKLTVQAISERGTTITDTYSLQGMTAAFQALQGGCG